MISAVVCLAVGEGARRAVVSPQGGAFEESVVNAVQWLRLVVETTGALVITLGVVLAAWQFARGLAARRAGEGFNPIRLTLARYLALALEFQLGADILSTAVAPSWDQIGKLGAIAVIRTGLNYFLMREMREERQAGGARTDQTEGGEADAAGGRDRAGGRDAAGGAR